MGKKRVRGTAIVYRGDRLYHCDYESANNYHKVSLIETDDDPAIRSAELCEFTWWDQSQDLPRFRHVDAILALRHDDGADRS